MGKSLLLCYFYVLIVLFSGILICHCQFSNLVTSGGNTFSPSSTNVVHGGTGHLNTVTGGNRHMTLPAAPVSNFVRPPHYGTCFYPRPMIPMMPHPPMFMMPPRIIPVFPMPVFAPRPQPVVVKQEPVVTRVIEKPPVVAVVPPPPPPVKKTTTTTTVEKFEKVRPVIEVPVVHTVIEKQPVVQTVIEKQPVVHTVLEQQPAVHTVIENQPVVHTVIEKQPVVHTLVENPIVIAETPKVTKKTTSTTVEMVKKTAAKNPVTDEWEDCEGPEDKLPDHCFEEEEGDEYYYDD